MTKGRHNANPYLDRFIRIIRDPLAVEDGGYAPGTTFSRTDMQSMLAHSAFTTGTEVEFLGCHYQIVTINSPTGSKQIMAELEIVKPKGE
jgi:hypothetical protein